MIDKVRYKKRKNKYRVRVFRHCEISEVEEERRGERRGGRRGGMHSDGGGLPDSAACLAERAILGSWLVQHQYRDPVFK